MGYKHCSVIGCKNNSNSERKNLSFFTTRTKELLYKWKANTEIEPKKENAKQIFICSDHFSEEEIYIDKRGRKHLKNHANAVPTIFKDHYGEDRIVETYLKKVKDDIGKVSGRAFWTGRGDSFINQPIGKNSFFGIPHEIAEHLQKENPETYSYLSVRRTPTAAELKYGASQNQSTSEDVVSMEVSSFVKTELSSVDEKESKNEVDEMTVEEEDPLSLNVDIKQESLFVKQEVTDEASEFHDVPDPNQPGVPDFAHLSDDNVPDQSVTGDPDFAQFPDVPDQSVSDVLGGPGPNDVPEVPGDLNNVEESEDIKEENESVPEMSNPLVGDSTDVPFQSYSLENTLISVEQSQTRTTAMKYVDMESELFRQLPPDTEFVQTRALASAVIKTLKDQISFLQKDKCITDSEMGLFRNIKKGNEARNYVVYAAPLVHSVIKSFQIENHTLKTDNAMLKRIHEDQSIRMAELKNGIASELPINKKISKMMTSDCNAVLRAKVRKQEDAIVLLEKLNEDLKSQIGQLKNSIQEDEKATDTELSPLDQQSGSLPSVSLLISEAEEQKFEMMKDLRTKCSKFEDLYQVTQSDERNTGDGSIIRQAIKYAKLDRKGRGRDKEEVVAYKVLITEVPWPQRRERISKSEELIKERRVKQLLEMFKLMADPEISLHTSMVLIDHFAEDAKVLMEAFINKIDTLIEKALDYACYKCNYIYLDDSTLRDHIVKTHHARYHCQVCKICGEDFVDNTTDFFKAHIETHRVKCPRCDRTNLASVKALRLHASIVHGDKAEFDCGICGKKFSTAFDLKRHMVRHRPVSANFPVSNVDNVKESGILNSKKSGNLDYKESENLDSKESGNLNAKKSGNLNCKECGKRFRKESMYNLHMERVHDIPSSGGKETFGCARSDFHPR